MTDGADSRALRNALACYATGIAVVTAGTDHGDPIGMTMNSFSSVSLDPPLVLFSIDRRAYSLAAFGAARGYAVNILAAHQAPLCARFARALSDKWDGVRHRPGYGGAPVIEGALAYFECAPWAAYDGGDHQIFVGRVESFGCDGAADALVYFAGRYATLGRDQAQDDPRQTSHRAG